MSAGEYESVAVVEKKARKSILTVAGGHGHEIGERAEKIKFRGSTMILVGDGSESDEVSGKPAS